MFGFVALFAVAFVVVFVAALVVVSAAVFAVALVLLRCGGAYRDPALIVEIRECPL